MRVAEQGEGAEAGCGAPRRCWRWKAATACARPPRCSVPAISHASFSHLLSPTPLAPAIAYAAASSHPLSPTPPRSRTEQ
eukprot:38108-Rhodomonas_salina.1